jgi:hypothetical protein
MDGALFKAKSGRKLHGFLFNDLLILAEPLKSLNPKGYLYNLYREVKFQMLIPIHLLIHFFIAYAHRNS